ncbi:MAG: FAD-dependent oxidoreductase [Desulfobacterales bacterium]|nr:FAD-dependent oxidoreductase [Desulfobacterales bacterium]
MHRVETDVLVIGGGAAAGRAAVEAAKYGLRVVLVDKGRFGKSGSTPFTSAMAVSFEKDEEENTWQGHIQDTLSAGNGLASRRFAEIMVKESLQRLNELEEFGAVFQRHADGRLMQNKAMGQTVPRSTHIDFSKGDYMDVLRREAFHRGVRVYEQTMVASLLGNGEKVDGALAVSKSGEMYFFSAKAFVMGAGSATKLFPYASSVLKTTGDSTCLGLACGAQAIDMEFTELTLTPLLRGVPLSIGGIGTMVRWGAKYLNAAGERFMERYDPIHLEGTERSRVVTAVFKEIKAGRGPVICDFSEVPKDKVIHQTGYENPLLLHKRKSLEKTGQLEWTIVIHRLLGGLAVDENGKTGLKNLWAAGEAAGGIHGAARVAANAVLETQVFGARAGRAAALTASQMLLPTVTPKKLNATVTKLRSLEGKPSMPALSARRLTEKVQHIMDAHANVVRNGTDLEKGLEQIREIRQNKMPLVKGPVIEVLEAHHLAMTAELVLTAAFERRETRGNHRREDYPQRDDVNWQRHIGLSLADDDSIKIESVPVGN